MQLFEALAQAAPAVKPAVQEALWALRGVFAKCDASVMGPLEVMHACVFLDTLSGMRAMRPTHGNNRMATP